MTRAILGAAALGLAVGLGAASATRGVEGRAPRGVLAELKLREPITLKDLGTAYEVSVFDRALPTGEEVAEVGDDYLVVKNLAGIETRVPITSIKAVVRISTK